MIDITSFILKHLYELMADNYNATPPQHSNTRSQQPPEQQQQQQQQQQPRQQQQQQQQQWQRQSDSKPEQETNQQIVSFLINNQLPDLACETLIELIFICVFLAVSWIFVMIFQLHCHQLNPAQSLLEQTDLALEASHMPHSKASYCNTKFLNSLMYCNNYNSPKQFSS